MSTLRRFLTGSALAVVAVGIASADTIIPPNMGTQSSTGAIATLSVPPNNGGITTASVNKFNVTQANNAINAYCLLNSLICGTANLYQIDVSITGTASGSLNMINTSGGVADILCNNSNGPGCSAISGTETLSVLDPLNTQVGIGTATTFNVNENGGPNGFGQYFYALPTGTTPESGSLAIVDPFAQVYNTSSSGWNSTVAAAYVGSGNVSFNIALSGNANVGSAPTGVTDSNNTAALTGGNLSVEYLYNFTESPIGGAPEPTTMVLFGSALVGLGCIRKRIRKS